MEADTVPAEDGQRQALHRRLIRIAAWLGGIAALLGRGIGAARRARPSTGSTISSDKVAAVPAGRSPPGWVLESLQTSLAALAWYGILRAALPRAALCPSASSSPTMRPP